MEVAAALSDELMEVAVVLSDELMQAAAAAEGDPWGVEEAVEAEKSLSSPRKRTWFSLSRS